MRLTTFFITTVFLAGCATVQSQSPTPVPHEESTIGTDGAPEIAATPSALPVARKNSYTEVRVQGKFIALTFDDGPSKTLTPKLLATLKQYDAHCTFFVIGENATDHPEILREAVANGNEIANHSWNHPSLSTLSVSGINSQLDRTDAAIEKAVGYKPKLVRPPYGATNATVRKIIADRGQTVVLWSVDPLDWKYRNSERVENQLVHGAAPGAIELAHDIHPTTVAAIDGVLSQLTAQGYKFVTVTDLLAREIAPPPPATPKPKPAAQADAEVAPTSSPEPAASATPTMGTEATASPTAPL